MVNGTGFVENLHSQGSVSEWNTYNPQEMQICPGDRIDGWKVKGKHRSRLTNHKELSPVHHRAITLQITKPFSYVVSAFAPFGIRTKKDNCDKAFFIVSSITPSGSIHRWNEKNADNLVSVGDIILGVNGVRCTAHEVLYLLEKFRLAVVELMVLHFPR